MDLAKILTFPVIYKIHPDGNFGSEKEDMYGKIRTYGSPNLFEHHYTNNVSAIFKQNTKIKQRNKYSSGIY